MNLLRFRHSGRHNRGYLIFRFACFIIGIIITAIYYIFCVPSQKLQCIADQGCTVYRKANYVSQEVYEYSFNPKDIKSFKYVEHYHSKKHGGYYTYSIVLDMKDGKKIDLDTFEGSKDSQQQMVNNMWYNNTFTKKSRF